MSRWKGETLDRGLIENLEELFGVGPHNSENKTRFTIDEELPNVLDTGDKKAFDVEYEVPSEVIHLMAKNLEGLEQGLTSHQASESDGDGGGGEVAGEPLGGLRLPERRHVRVKTIRDVCGGGAPPPGALAKIVIVANRRLERTRIVFASVDGREQHAFCLNTADLRQAPPRREMEFLGISLTKDLGVFCTMQFTVTSTGGF